MLNDLIERIPHSGAFLAPFVGCIVSVPLLLLLLLLQFVLQLYADVIRGLTAAEETLTRRASAAIAPLLAFSEAPPTPAQYVTAKRRLQQQQQQQQQEAGDKN